MGLLQRAAQVFEQLCTWCMLVLHVGQPYGRHGLGACWPLARPGHMLGRSGAAACCQAALARVAEGRHAALTWLGIKRKAACHMPHKGICMRASMRPHNFRTHVMLV